VIPDVQSACDRLRPVFDQSVADDGYVSLEVSPRLAYQTEETVRAASRLRDTVGRENVLIKVPATPPGVAAFEELVAQGINVNVTLMFSLAQARKVEEAYIRGARQWLDRGGDARSLKCVESLFLSRIDTLADRRLEQAGTEEALALRGFAGTAVAKLAHQRWKATFHGPTFAPLAAAGVRPPYLLWASTGTKNARYSDVMYVEPLIGPETINTMPDATLAAFRDHGRIGPTLEEDVDRANAHWHALERFGIELHALGEVLQSEGVKSFDDSYRGILELMG
jgi:transaldolase